MIFKQIDIIAPKGFTPNGDGHNDKLQFFLLGIDQLNFFRVFNRWGQLMFETTDPYQFWDGKYKGIDQPLETYVWMAQGRGRDGKTIVRRGQTILIR
jgi:gliding motility-associated-like protein